MKRLRLILTAFLLMLLSSSVFAQDQELMAEFSLFFEYHKNQDFQSSLPHGWNVVNKDPAPFVRYRLFTRMEEALFHMHDNVAQTEEEKNTLADTTLFLYDKAMEHEPEKKAYYLARRAYVLEIWKEADVPVVLEAYEVALAEDPALDNFYKDRYGILLANNALDENDYKLKALELYSDMSEAEPENAVWISRIEALADNPDELVEITYRAWQLDKENLEKAWKYASTAIRNQNFDKSIEALEFLVEKSPDVINYWSQLSNAYQKEGMTQEAIEGYKKLIELQPDNREHYLNLAVMYKNLGQLSVARSYLQQASKADPEWDFPVYIEAQLYEQAARNCGFEFMDKVVYQLAVNTYRRAANLGGRYRGPSLDRVNALSNSVPAKEDYFFRKINSGDTIKIEGRCYDWIGRSITAP